MKFESGMMRDVERTQRDARKILHVSEEEKTSWPSDDATRLQVSGCGFEPLKDSP